MVRFEPEEPSLWSFFPRTIMVTRFFRVVLDVFSPSGDTIITSAGEYNERNGIENGRIWRTTNDTGGRGCSVKISTACH